jgi:HSP20 family protein
MDEAFRDFDRPLWGFGLGTEAWPPTDLRDKGDELVLQADVPGMTEKEISVEATGQSITIRGERKVEPPKGYTAHRTERSPIRFSRSFSLPCEIDLETVKASTKNGVLIVTAAKRPEARPKQIAIQAS